MFDGQDLNNIKLIIMAFIIVIYAESLLGVRKRYKWWKFLRVATTESPDCRPLIEITVC
jgi:hypothetical protein